ncbi:ras GEF [Microthyrium microscopicum]|uniref:Ras GEF n=1 Tax=Microthyrium microscopicum TaxID=703497 RepID=A0A6A6UFK0_9PEZI|nr:ras GEF [Microthyrium microscopicum]
MPTVRIPTPTKPPPTIAESPIDFNEKHPHFHNKPPSSLSSDTPPAQPAHLPFILAYPADHLAQQFTILEKDALDELDWRELIDLRWNQSPPPASDWVAYLRTPDPFGVGLVIARFNLMVKWVISEILLTDAPPERARCIMHYIRIAAHCRRLRNFATMYQITVALLSADCARLKHTWALVPAGEISVLQDLERVVQPLRNFHNLRMEMETAPTETGCIPFIGIYTRDLVYNAQKPAVITSAPQNEYEPLVNFERHHTAAGIVKGLLRLLEQSGRYAFTPDPVCLARCLWVSALEETEIRRRAELLE